MLCCRYSSPTQREEVFAATLRQQKQDVQAQAAALLRQYGAEGAAAMQHILTLKKPDRKVVHIKASREDIQAVLQLPAAGLADP